MSPAEVEKIRDLAAAPDLRVEAFQQMLQERLDAIAKLVAQHRVEHRETQIHDLMEQFVSMSDELSDNLDEYQLHHNDLRKALPKLVEASAKWPAILNQPPENIAYSVSRKDALTTANDMHDSAQKLLDEQKAWFKEHPPVKDNAPGEAPKPVIIPR